MVDGHLKAGNQMTREPNSPNILPRAHQLGTDGEELAASFMIGLGFRVLERRFSRRGGEIDLICAMGGERGAAFDEVVFVEVKTRTGRSFGRPEAAVSGRKRIRMKRTAEVFLHERGLSCINVRFDVISIIQYGANEQVLEHFVDAFGIHEFMGSDAWSDWRL